MPALPRVPTVELWHSEVPTLGKVILPDPVQRVDHGLVGHLGIFTPALTGERLTKVWCLDRMLRETESSLGGRNGHEAQLSCVD
jgi:hypothetical protein